MYYLIETENQLDQLISQDGGDQCYIEFIPVNDHINPTINHPTALYFFNEKGYLINITHPHSPSTLQISKVMGKLCGKYKTLLTPSKKTTFHYWQNPNITDIESRLYLNNLEQPNIPKTFAQNFMYKLYPYTQTNKLVAVGKLYEYYDLRRELYLKLYEQTESTKASEWYNNKLIPALNWVEQQGIGFNGLDKVYDIHPSYSTKDGRFFSQYNFQTTTGRPSNKFDNVNLMALKKNSEQREWIVPKNDYLVEIDFDGYHPRIIGDLIGQPLDKGKSVHEQLGKLYFNTDNLTEDQYKKSKELTFKQLYGGIFDEYKELGFFKKTNKYIEETYRKFKEVGYVELPISGRRFYEKDFPNINPQKLLNYIIQMSETERNIQIILVLMMYLQNKKTKLIMYVYDAFVFDVSEEDGPELVEDLKRYISSDVFGVSITTGKNYNEM